MTLSWILVLGPYFKGTPRESKPENQPRIANEKAESLIEWTFSGLPDEWEPSGTCKYYKMQWLVPRFVSGQAKCNSGMCWKGVDAFKAYYRTVLWHEHLKLLSSRLFGAVDAFGKQAVSLLPSFLV